MHIKVTFPGVYIILPLLTLWMSSCAPTYVPNALNTPLLYEKGEVAASLHTGLNTFEAQVATAVTGNGSSGLAVMGNFSHRNTGNEESGGDFSRHTYGEAGVGYYFNLGEVGALEVYTGYGAGQGSAGDTYSIGNSVNRETAEGKYQRAFLQTNIGATTRFIEGGFGLRGSYVNFTEYMEDDPITGDLDAVFLEPTLFMRIGGGGLGKGGPNIKGSIQVGLNAPLKEEIAFDSEALNVNIGISFRFGRDYIRNRMKDIRNR